MILLALTNIWEKFQILELGFLFIVGIVFQVGYRHFAVKAKSFQSIYHLSPESHQKKRFIPTMGGLGILAVTLVGGLLHGGGSAGATWVLGVLFSFSLIGFLDDSLSLMRENNKGLSAKHKFTLQIGFGVGLIACYHVFILPLSLLQSAFYVFLLVGTSNATNLTDGLDGLLGGTSLISLLGFYLLSLSVLPHLSWVPLILFVAVLSFLVFNLHPAKVFMGDTGSLGLGAAFAAFAIVLGQPLVLIPLGIVYIIETLSVIIQVVSFKSRGKRVFLMSPIHHHFELLGLKEPAVVLLFWAIGACGVLVLFATM